MKKPVETNSSGQDARSFEQINRELSASLDLPTVLSSVLFQSIKLVGAERGTLIIMDEGGSPIDAAIVYYRQLIPHTIDQLKDTLRKGLAGWVYKHQEPVLIEDTSRDDRWLQRPDDSITQTGPKSAICVPIKAPRGELVGILTIVHSEPGFLHKDHLQSLNAMADHAGNAIFNARLYSHLEHAQVRLQGLFESSLDPIVITDADGHFIEANNRFHILTSFAPEALSGKSIELFYPEFDEEYLRRTESITSGLINAGEANLVLKSGSTMPVEVYIEKTHFEGKAVLQWLFRDITARKALLQMQEEMIAMVYHDLKSPLSNVISALQMIESTMQAEGCETSRAVLDIATRSTNRMERLINSLLNIYELEAGQKITTQVRIPLETVLQDAVQAVLPAAANKQIEIKYKLPVGIPELFIDPDMITRVLINIIENSVRLTSSGGTIRLHVAKVGEFVQLGVSDNGKGFPEKLVGRVFDKFVKDDSGDKGNGLGLAFCKLVVEAHGGEISAENNPEGGATVNILLPVYQNNHHQETSSNLETWN